MSTITVLPTTKTLAETTETLRSPITIRDDFGTVDKELVHIRKGKEVEWINAAEHQVQIIFDEGPPFDWKEPFVVQAKKVKGSGVQKKDVLLGHRYKYTVVGFMGNNDPIIIIDP